MNPSQASAPRRALCPALTVAALAVALLAPASAQAQQPRPDALSLTPTGHIGLRYHGAFLIDGDDSNTLRNGPELSFALGLALEAPAEQLRGAISVRGGDPAASNLPWSNLGNFTNDPDVALEQAWLSLGTSPLPELALRFGLAPAPWEDSGLFWDADVRLPGVWVDYDRRGAADALWQRVRFSAGLAWIFTGGPRPEDEILLLSLDSSARWSLGQGWLEAEVGHFHLVGARRFGRGLARGDLRVGFRPAGFTAATTDTDDDPGVDADVDELTRRLVLNGLSSEFRLLRGRVAVGLPLGDDGPPLIFDLAAVVNLGAAGPGADAGLGLEVGAALGAADAPGEGAVRLFGVMIGADAVLDAFNADLYGANIMGAGVSGALVLFEGFSIGFEALLSQQLDAELRGLGDGRGEELVGDPAAAQLRVTTAYVF